MITQIKFYSGKQMKKPAAGDEKIMKDGTVMIRQQRKFSGMWVVNNGRPVYEWVVKGSGDDRAHQISSRIKGYCGG